MTAAIRRLRPASIPSADPMGALRSALATGQLNPSQMGALDALLATFAAPAADETPAASQTLLLSNEEVLERYLRSGTAMAWRNTTVRVRRSQLNMIARALAPTTLVEATEEDLLDWHEQLAKWSPETVGSYTSCAKGLFRWMTVKARPRIRLDDPTLILDRPRVPERQPRPINSGQFDLALACAVSDPEMYAWFGLMGCSGLRCCEVAWLMIEDVEELDGGGGLLHITGKGGKQRTVPAGPHLMKVLRAFVRGRVIGPVFTRPSDGGPHTANQVSVRVSRFLRDLRIPATAHQLRHRWASDYHALDPDLYRQARLMGHSSVDTTQRYTEINPVEAIEFVEKMTRRRLGGGQMSMTAAQLRAAQRRIKS